MQNKKNPRKRKRGDKGDGSGDDDSKCNFNTTARCSLKELASCLKLLEQRHLDQLADGGLGHLKDFKVKGNINR